MVNRSIDQKLRLRNFDARHGRIETGAVVKNRQGLSGVEGGKGTCNQWKEKGHCSKEDQSSFQHESDDRAQQKPHPNAATPSGPSMTRGRSVSRKRNIIAKVILVSFFDNRADTIWKVLARDRLVSIGIFPNVNSIKTNRDVKQGTSVCSRIIRLTNNRTKSRKRATLPKREEKATTKMQWLLWKLYLSWVVSGKTRSYWILK